MTWIALIGVMASQGTSPIVNIERMVAPAGETVKKIGAEYGEAWAVEGTVATDVVFVASHGKSAEQMRRAIAGALQAEWKEQSTGWVLTRKPVTENRLAAEAVNMRREWLKSELASQVSQIEKLPEFNDKRAKEIAEKLAEPVEDFNFSKNQELMDELPEFRHVPKILAMLDPATLANLEPEERVVFASRPTAMQKQLPSTIQVLANSLAKDQAIMDAAEGGQTIRMSGGGSVSFSTRIRRGPGEPEPEPKGPPAFTHVVVQRESDGETYSAQVNVYDAKGAVLVSSHYALQLMAVNRPGQTTDFEGTATITPGKLEQEIIGIQKAKLAQSGGTTSVFGLSIASGSSGTMISTSDRIDVGRPDLSPELRKALLDPIKVDPVTFFFADSAKAVSIERKLDVIAVIPDSVLPSLSRLFSTEFKTGGFLENLQYENGLKVEKGEGWITISPHDWPLMWQGRHNRAGLEGLLGRLDQSGSITLDQLTQYAKTAPETVTGGFGAQGSLEGFYARLLQPSAVSTSLSNLFEHRRTLKFFSQLPIRTRSALMAGEEINVAGLDSSVRGILHRLVYWGGQGPRPGTAGLESDPFLSGAMFRISQDSANAERTVLMPRGITNDSKMRIQFKTDMSAEVKGQGGSTSIYSANVLAMDQLQREGTLSKVFGQFGQNSPPAPVEGFRDASQSKIAMQFAFGTTATFADTLTDYQVGSGTFGPYEGLSKLLRDEVEKQANQIRTAFANVKLGGGESAKP